MYLIEGTPKQSHQANIDSLRKLSNTEIFLINSTIRNLYTTPTPTTSAKAIGFGTQFHTNEVKPKLTPTEPPV